MNEDRQKFAELEELLAALRDGTIADEQMELLDRLLATDAGAREYYLEYMDLCATLGHFQGSLAGVKESGDAGGSVVPEGPGVTSPHSFKLPRSRPSATRRWLLVLALAAAAAVLLILGLTVSNRPWPGGSAPRHETDPKQPMARPGGPEPRNEHDPEKPIAEAVAVLTRAWQPEWEGEAPAVGTKFRARERLRLRSGIAQLEFFSGAVLVVEGPADFEPRGVGRVYCREGRVRARVSLPAEGFAIDSPAVGLVDRGTEFGFRIDRAGRAEVHVFNGKVELHNAADDALRADAPHLTTGKGVSIDPTGILLKIDADPNAFDRLSVAKLEQQWREELRLRHQKWLDHSQKLRADLRLLLYYTFQDQQPGERTLLNQAIIHKGEFNGAIIGCSWSEGRWPGKGALDFKRPDNRVRIHVPGKYESLTFLAWVRVDAFDQQLNALMLTDGFDEGAPHWQLSNWGTMFLGIKDRAVDMHHNYHSPVFLGPDKLGEWLQLATVYDHHSRTVRHYVDGRPVSREDLHFDIALRIGNVEIGNWGRTVPVPPRMAIRNFNGRIDEFALFREALSPEEIARLHEFGKASP